MEPVVECEKHTKPTTPTWLNCELVDKVLLKLVRPTERVKNIFQTDSSSLPIFSIVDLFIFLASSNLMTDKCEHVPRIDSFLLFSCFHVLLPR
jgi:hypothetical protein